MPGEDHETKPISLFYSYSHKDQELRNDLADHLVPLERAGLIEVWHDRDMLPGDTVDEEIARKLQSVDVVLVLVSPSFIRSKYCYDLEMAKAIERHRRGEARVVPVIVRPCQWQLTPLKELLAMPTDGRAVTEWPNRDTAFNDVAKAITKLATAMRRTGSKDADPAAVGAKPAPEGPGAGTLLTPPRVFADFTVFRDIDAPWCPEMVALPAGEFLMGSPESEEGRRNNEGPQHKVTIGYRFAMGRFPVTVGQYRRFVEATDRRHEGGLYGYTGLEWKLDEAKSWHNPGFAQTDRHPVVGVNWQDAIVYCDWLANETGKPYRLPSEAEWEYACRAGTTTPFSFGKTMTKKDANFPGVTVGKTTEIGSFLPNLWGIHDMHGNVWEWVEDIWHDSYQGAPADGSAWTDTEGKNSWNNRSMRGGSWGTVPGQSRSASRLVSPPGVRGFSLGFRVARTLD